MAHQSWQIGCMYKTRFANSVTYIPGYGISTWSAFVEAIQATFYSVTVKVFPSIYS